MVQLASLVDTPVRFKLTDYVRTHAKLVAADNPLTTNGWDTVFAIRLTDVNNAITKNAAYPTTFAQANTDIDASVTGTFGPWQLTTGGTGSMLRMAIPVAGVLISNASSPTPRQHPFSNGTAIAEVYLQYIPSAPQGNSGVPNNLQLRQSAEEPVEVPQITFSGTQPDGIVAPFLRILLEEWFADNLQEFQHTFATVNLNAIADKAEWQWLKPTATGYAYNQPNVVNPNPDDCVFAAMCMTNDDAQLGDNVVSLQAIPSGQRAGFLISAQRYLDSVLMKQLPGTFSNSSVADFQIVPGTTQIKNVNALTMEPLNGYVPTIAVGDFVVNFTAGEITTSIAKAHVPISPGIDLYLNYVIHAGCRLQTKADGTHALQLYDTQPIEYDHEVETASWVTITEVTAGIIAGIVLAGVGSVAGKAAVNALAEAGKMTVDSISYRLVKWLIAAVIGGIVGGLVGNIANIIVANAESNAEGLPTFDPFAKEAVASITWPDSSGAVLTSVAFNSSLQFGIDPVFTE